MHAPGANLNNADLDSSTLANADLSGANLTGAYANSSTLTNADLTGALVSGASFGGTTFRGFTQAQLASTVSYQAKDLSGIGLGSNNLSGWDFHGQNLTNASLDGSTLTNSDLSDANLTNAALGGSTLLNADMSGANLTNAYLGYSRLANVKLSGAVVSGAGFYNTTSYGFTQAQLASTSSYQARDLSGVGLEYNDLSGWNFHGQNLTSTSLGGSTLINADLSEADTRGAQGIDLTDAIVHNTIQPDGTIAALELAGDARLVVRDDDGVPDPAPTWWLSPRPPIGITIEDQMSMSDEGALRLLFESDPWDSLISFEPGISVQLGGMLELTFAEDVDVATQIGRTIRIFDWTGVAPTGTFVIASPYDWDTSELYTTGEISLTAVPEPSGLLIGSTIAVALGAVTRFAPTRRPEAMRL